MRRSGPAGTSDFYPRSPRGERPYNVNYEGSDGKFLSTLPARGATDAKNGLAQAHRISIHAPREGSDSPSST